MMTDIKNIKFNHSRCILIKKYIIVSDNLKYTYIYSSIF